MVGFRCVLAPSFCGSRGGQELSGASPSVLVYVCVHPAHAPCPRIGGTRPLARAGATALPSQNGASRMSGRPKWRTRCGGQAGLAEVGLRRRQGPSGTWGGTWRSGVEQHGVEHGVRNGMEVHGVEQLQAEPGLEVWFRRRPGWRRRAWVAAVLEALCFLEYEKVRCARLLTCRAPSRSCLLALLSEQAPPPRPLLPQLRPPSRALLLEALRCLEYVRCACLLACKALSRSRLRALLSEQAPLRCLE